MKPEVIIVLGVDAPGGKISKEMKSRVDEALKIYKGNKGCKILMAGGFSLRYKGTDPGFRESQVMREYAIRQGVNKGDVLTEESSRDTLGNAYFTKPLVKKRLWKRIAIVTSDFHIGKARFMFDLVYGDGYDFEFCSVDSGLSMGEMMEREENEKSSVRAAKDIVVAESIRKGEDEKVGGLLRKFYKSVSEGKQMYRLRAHGRVQGVFFRRNVKRYADSHKLRGNVENKGDGSVLIHLQCTKKEADSFVKWLESSPGASKVDKVEIERVWGKGFKGFEIIREDNFLKDQGKSMKNLGKKILSG
ncbi:MAG: ElyC/SanA/YdcF family protein [archaeon]